MEKLKLRIFYFDKIYFIKCKEDWERGYSNISLLDLSWNAFFFHKDEQHIIDNKFELKTESSSNVINNHSFLVIKNDILWFEVIPTFKDGFYFNKISDPVRLYSIRSLKEASELNKKIGVYNKYGELWFLNQVYSILNREQKLKEIGIF